MPIIDVEVRDGKKYLVVDVSRLDSFHTSQDMFYFELTMSFPINSSYKPAFPVIMPKEVRTALMDSVDTYEKDGFSLQDGYLPPEVE